ncbi:nucleoside/nucleotide kinase family protein [Flavivirga algicola]|uniref:Thymidylate kinase-like domain-containing protein n=1 Tax=Flavivirga algicola TaxID=2729136 RepID=A0ABX1RZL4_9FLAO|nr:hypothetical protein [Flavivirga algicola]NMH87634.1 hypothetical protein [Flavivirga algicola]
MIHELLKYLHYKSLDYAIISGYKALFEETSDIGDIDILFKKQDFLKIETVLKDFCELEGFKIVQIYHQEVYAKNIFIFNPKTTELLNLDTYGKLHRKQTVYFTETEIFKNCLSYKNVSTLVTHQEFLHYLLKKIDKNEITEVSFNYLRALFLKETIPCERVVKTCFKNWSSVVVEAFETNNKDLLLESIETLKKNIKVNTKLSYDDKIRNQIRILKRIVKPTGVAISFLGPDGSGKSTIINGLKNKTLPFRKTAYFHLKPIITDRNSASLATADPHKYAPYSKLKSYVKLLFFIFQYNLGWVKNIWPAKVKSTLVIFDRYYDDLIVDHKRYRYGGYKSIAKLIRIFIPKPKLYFILTADADTIYGRKQEVEREELQIQIENYKALVDGKQYHHINANKPPHEIVNKVYKILMKKMYERY